MKIELTSKTPKAQIRYTMDGTAPTEESALYSEPFEIAGFPFTVRARAYADGLTPSRYTELAGKSPEEWEKVAGSIFNGSSCPINANTVTNGNIIVTIKSNKVYYSTNGFDWAVVSQISNASWAGYTCGRFVVTTSNAQIYTSTDGINWQLATVTISEATLAETGGAILTYEIVRGNDARGFIACRQSYNVFFLLTSTDGINWVDTAGRFDFSASNIVYEKNILLVYCFSSCKVFRSVDNGQTFSLAYSFTSSGGVVFAGNYFYGQSSTKIFYSTDGETWTNISRTGVFARANVVYLNNKYFIVEAYGVAVSDDGLNWSFKTIDYGNQWFCYMGYINGTYVVSDSSANMFVSTDLENWTKLENSPRFNSGMYQVAGKLWGSKGYGCYYTDDGYNWRTAGADGIDTIYSIAKGEEGYIINSASKGTYFSRDLVNFTKITEITGNGQAVIYAGGKYVAGGTGKIFTSTDGENWSTHTLTKSADIVYIAYCNNMFIATGKSGFLATSADGESWTVCEIGITKTIGLVCYGNGLYVTGTEDGYVVTSADGVNWSYQSISTYYDFYGAFYAKGKYYLYGSRGLEESADGVNWVELSNDKTERTIINVNGIYLCLDLSGEDIYLGSDLYNMAGWTRLNFTKEIYEPEYRCLANVGDEIFIGGSYATLMKCELLKRSIEED